MFMKIHNDWRSDFCPLCGGDNVSRIGPLNYGRDVRFSNIGIEIDCIPELWKCCQCNSAFVGNALPPDIAESLYSMGQAGERWQSKAFEVEKTEVVVNSMAELTRFGDSILDVGCNTGELLDFARGFGCRTSGVEFSAASREVVRLKGHKIHSSLEEAPGQYDIITAFDLIEHLYDIPDFLTVCTRKLANNGKLVILTGDVHCFSARLCGTKWWYVNFPEHIAFPSWKFFTEYSNLRVEKWIPCFAGRWATFGKFASLKAMIVSIVNQHPYTGIPSPLSDHAFIVLVKD